jgi:hypothetical protein
MRTVVVMVAGCVLASCGGRSTPQGAVVTDVVTMRVGQAPPGRMLPDTGEAYRQRRLGMQRASDAGRRVQRLEVVPSRVELAVGEEYPLMSTIRVNAVDSSGRAVSGWAPMYAIASRAIARIAAGSLVGVQPGTTTLRVNVLELRDTTGLRPEARPGVEASMTVVVRPAVAEPYVPLSSPPDGPAQTVTAYLAALGAEQWKDAAALVDLERFGVYFRQRVSAARVQLPQPPMTFEDYARMYANGRESVPRAVLEWQYENMMKSRKFELPFGDFSREFAGVTSFRMLSELTVADAAARSLEAMDPRTQQRLTARLSGCDSTSTALAFERRPRQDRLVGVVMASDTTAWALVTGTPQYPFPGQDAPPGVMLLRRRAGSPWRVDPLARGYGMMGYAVSVDCARR